MSKNIEDLDKSQLVEIVKTLQSAASVANRPILTGRTSPYYAEKFAKQILPVVKQIIHDGKARLYKFEKYQWLNKASLYLRLYYSLQYIKDNLTDSFTKEEVSKIFHLITVKKRFGVAIQKRDEVDLEFNNPDLYETDVMDEESNYQDWKIELTDYLKNAEVGDKPLHLKRLQLTLAELEDCSNTLKNTENILYKLSQNELKVIKVSADDYERINTQISSSEQ